LLPCAGFRLEPQKSMEKFKYSLLFGALGFSVGYFMKAEPVTLIQLTREKTSESLRPTSPFDSAADLKHKSLSGNSKPQAEPKSTHNTPSVKSTTPSAKAQAKKTPADTQSQVKHIQTKKVDQPHRATTQATPPTMPNDAPPTHKGSAEPTYPLDYAKTQPASSSNLVAATPFFSASPERNTSVAESDKKPRHQKNSQEIIENILRLPTPEWARQALKAVQSGELSEIQYFSMAKELALRSDQASEQVAILLLSQWPSKNSFLTFIEIIQTKPAWSSKQELWRSYQNPTTVHHLLPLLIQTENPQTLHWGLRLVYEFITQNSAESRSTSSLTYPFRGQGWSRQSTGASNVYALGQSQRLQWAQWLEALSQRPLQDQWYNWVQVSLQHLQAQKELLAEAPQE